MRSLRPRAGMIRATLTAAMAVVLLASAIGPIAPARAGDPLTDALRQQKALRAKIATQQRELKALKASEAKLSARLTATQGALNEINADQATVRARIKEASTALAEVRASYKVLVRRVDELTCAARGARGRHGTGRGAARRHEQRILARHIADAYKTQQTSLLEQLLHRQLPLGRARGRGLLPRLRRPGRPSRVADRARPGGARPASPLDRRHAHRDAAHAVQVKAQYNEMVRQRDELKSAQERLEELETQTREAKAKQLTAYNAIRKNKSQTAALLAKGEGRARWPPAQISKLIARDMGNIPSAYSGSLLWPLSGTVTQSYGCSGFALEPSRGGCWPLSTERHRHRGSHVFADPGGRRRRRRVRRGEPLRPARGAGLDRGHCPLQEPGDLVRACRQREPSPAVHKGQWVNQGQVVAYVGMTGRTTGPHLHWMVELNGVFSNPRLFV